MEALYLSGGSLSYDIDFPEPRLEPLEALVEVSLAGICGTDLELVQGYAGFEGIVGHEMLGRVRDCPDQPALVGQRVVADINIGCGSCDRCRSDRAKHCASRQVLGIRDRPGCFSSRVTVPVTNLVPVPAEVDDQSAVFAEPLAAALEVVPQLPSTTAEVLVIGAGRLGQLILRVLIGAGLSVSAVCRHESHRRLAEEAGATVVSAGQLRPESFGAVVDSSGSSTGLALALETVVSAGRVVVKSTCARAAPLDMAPLVVKEICLKGSRCGSLRDALQTLAQGLVQPQPLIDSVRPLSEGVEAFEEAARPGALKVLVQPRAGTR